MLFQPKEKGQGLVEYAIILAVIAIVVIACSGCLWFLLIPFVIAKWPAISAWGANLIAGIMAGNPAAIFTAVVIVLILLWIFRRRRS